MILGVLVFGALLFVGDFEEIARQSKNISPLTLVTIIALTLLNDFFRFAKWEYLLSNLNIRLGLKKSALIFLSGFSMTITPGKVGEAIKSYLIKKSNGIKIRNSIGAVFFERLFGLPIFLLEFFTDFNLIQMPIAVLTLLEGSISIAGDVLTIFAIIIIAVNVFSNYAQQNK